MAGEATGRESDKFMLRLPDGMRDQLRAAAEANGRSMNSELVARLAASFAQPSPALPPADLNAMAKAVADGLYDRMFNRTMEDKDIVARRILFMERLAEINIDNHIERAEALKKAG